MQSDPWNTFEAPFLFRIFPPKNDTPSAIFILIHGWTGNEHSMSVFHQAATGNAYCIAPRGIVEIEPEKYGWIDIRKNPNPTYSDYSSVSKQLFGSIQSLIRSYGLDSDQKINLIGFSQGTGISISLALEYPDSFNKVALLSGFLPANPPENPPASIRNLQVYIAHGTQDKIVDFTQAEKMNAYLSSFGVQTIFCQEDIGHKIGAKCVLNLKKFFRDLPGLEKRKQS